MTSLKTFDCEVAFAEVPSVFVLIAVHPSCLDLIVKHLLLKCVFLLIAAHPSCLDLTEKMVQVVSTYPWQCMECKTCVECMDPYDEVRRLFG